VKHTFQDFGHAIDYLCGKSHDGTKPRCCPVFRGWRLGSTTQSCSPWRRYCQAVAIFAMPALSYGCAPPPCTCIVKLPPMPAACSGTDQSTSGDLREASQSKTANSEAQLHNDSSKRTVIWDGDGEGKGAKGWADCEKKPNCKSTLQPQEGAGLLKSVGLKLRSEGDGWMGGGWNFFGWWPANAGLDISGFHALRFAIRVESKDNSLAPDPATFTLYLKCSSKKEGCQSQTLNIAKYVDGNLFDGAWHLGTFPVADLTKEGFDIKSVSELDLSTWSKNRKEFSIDVDDIAFLSK